MKPIFSRNIDINKMAFMNWRIEKGYQILNMLNMSEGFLLSAIELITNCLKSNSDKRADIIIFPILTNANHGIELYLKSINWMLNKILASDRRIEGGHDIKQLLQTVTAKFKIYEGQVSFLEFETSTKELKNYIDELFTKTQASYGDDRMDFSRYSLDKKYNDHFYVLEYGNVEIDMENLLLKYKDIQSNLDSLANFMYDNELASERS